MTSQEEHPSPLPSSHKVDLFYADICNLSTLTVQNEPFDFSGQLIASEEQGLLIDMATTLFIQGASEDLYSPVSQMIAIAGYNIIYGTVSNLPFEKLYSAIKKVLLLRLTGVLFPKSRLVR